MLLLPLSLVRLLAPALQPIRALVARRWLREAEVDAVLSWLHPAWRLNRVMAQVIGREWVSDDLLALRLRCTGNTRCWRPGQHVPLYLQLNGVRHCRTYSLTRVGGSGEIELGIRRQVNGRLSNHLVEHVGVGSLLELGPAEGELHWPQHATGVALLAAGSGITALLGLLREALAKGYEGPVTLLHYVHEAGQRAYIAELQQLVRRHVNVQVRWLLTGSEAAPTVFSGRVQAAHLHDLRGFELLVCGSAGFVDSVRGCWSGELQSEAFSAPARNAEPGEVLRLNFSRSHVLAVGDSHRSLLEQAEALGLRPAHGCRQGICASCTCLLLEGAVRDVRSGVVSAGPEQPIRLCVSAPVGDVRVDL